ncbi:hypothetical protein LGK95_08470 [Clostridium algoriphilum]|uniref:hypothetical protein n=1 Tax=Clostridium algoriphilum TaxID=198347 RepID=UPI001CF552D7|nr:hypothetical protein [Clostridium algoriphilum]MCB2293554.1 hypothetical protein [Clostridium algoriphilum]
MSKIEIKDNEAEKSIELDDVNTKKIYTGENDEEVLNCEGNPCNFVYDEDTSGTD